MDSFIYSKKCILRIKYLPNTISGARNSIMSKNQILSLPSETIHSRREIKIKYIDESKIATLLGSVNKTHILGVYYKDLDSPRCCGRLPFKSDDRAKTWGQKALTRQGVEGGTSHVRGADGIGRGAAVLKKREVVTDFLTPCVLILQWHILDHPSPCSHFIWTLCVELAFLPCLTAPCDFSDAFLKDRPLTCSVKPPQYVAEHLSVIIRWNKGKKQKKMTFKNVC